MIQDNTAWLDTEGKLFFVENFPEPAFVFNTSEVGVAEAISHEAGHNPGLSHDGVINGASYYSGYGSGATGWAPIMGVGYCKQLVQWSQGEYANANNTQDDIQIIQNNGALLIADDHGNDQANSTVLGNTTDGTTVTLNGAGLIERRADIDFFHFVSGKGNVSLTINPVPFSPNLDILVELYDANGLLISISNPVDGLSASINETALPAGEYFISVYGAGKGDPLGISYTDYASLGLYSISGSVPDPGVLQSPVAVAVATATLPLSGSAPFTLYLFGNESHDPDGYIQSYEWDFGDIGTDTIVINMSQPPAINQYPTSENYVSGTVTGSYTNTLADDGVTEYIRELETGGRPSKRYSYLEHVWKIPVQSGNSVALFINAWQSGTVDNDSFVFAYSTDGTEEQLTLMH